MDDEINQLDEVEMMTMQAIHFRDLALNHAALLARAADALSDQLHFIEAYCCDGYPDCRQLIDELRKAAQ